MRLASFVLLTALAALSGCTGSDSKPPEKDERLRRMSELTEKRVSPPYFQLKAGCKLPEMSFDRGWRQRQAMEFLDQKDWSNIVLRSEYDNGKSRRLGFFEDHTRPETDKIKNVEKLYLRERNLSLIDNRAVREITDSHCNMDATYGGIVSDIRPNYGDIPDRMRLKIIRHDPGPRIDPPGKPQEPGPFEKLINAPRVPVDDTARYGVIICFETDRPRRLLIVDEAELRPWLNPKDDGICEPVNWDEFEDNTVEIFID